MIKCIVFSFFLLTSSVAAKVETCKHKSLQAVCSLVKNNPSPELIEKIQKLNEDLKQTLIHYLFSADETRRERYKEVFKVKAEFVPQKTLDFKYLMKSDSSHWTWVKQAVVTDELAILVVYYLKNDEDSPYPRPVFGYSTLYVIDLEKNEILYEERFEEKVATIERSPDGAYFSISLESAVYLYKREAPSIFSKKKILECSEPQALKFHYDGAQLHLYAATVSMYRRPEDKSNEDFAIWDVLITDDSVSVKPFAIVQRLKFFTVKPGTNFLVTGQVMKEAKPDPLDRETYRFKLNLWDIHTFTNEGSILFSESFQTGGNLMYFDAHNLKAVIMDQQGLFASIIDWQKIEELLRTSQHECNDFSEVMMPLTPEREPIIARHLPQLPFRVNINSAEIKGHTNLHTLTARLYQMYGSSVEAEYPLYSSSVKLRTYSEAHIKEPDFSDPLPYEGFAPRDDLHDTDEKAVGDAFGDFVFVLNRYELQAYILKVQDFKIQLPLFLLLEYLHSMAQNKSMLERDAENMLAKISNEDKEALIAYFKSVQNYGHN
jgi:hypothetical protein